MIELLLLSILIGADPIAEVTDTAERGDSAVHWSFRPPVAPPRPTVRNPNWAQAPIDEFILAKLEAADLSPAPPADKRTLIRRVTFDLLGLPPTPAEIDAFLADDSPGAFAKLVDRLLASPAYGERWGRHWLDVARYADSNGLDENVAHGNAWRYRDYVVSAFNRDKPYDRFVFEQIAGDLLPAEDETQRHENLIATGFLTIGPKVLAEVDETKMQMDIIDEQIDTVGRALLGLTLGCARCHDHKFDPIATADYYGLVGIFKSTKAMEHYKKIAKWHENVLTTPLAKQIQAEFDKQLADKQQEIDAVVAKADEQVRQKAAPDAKLPEKLESLYSNETRAELRKLRTALTQFKTDGPELPAAMGVSEGQVADVAIHVRGSHLKLGAVVERHTPPAVLGASMPKFPATESGRRELAQWMTDPLHPLTSRVMVNRVWRWHFGKGLVRTPDNFGLLGERPSHPELLDWLTCRFVADGWSIKSLHRLILNSSTYKQSAHPSPETTTRDPENRLYGRADVRRLEAEAVRDALLAVSGLLDDSPGGSLLTVKNRAFFFDHTSKDLTKYDSRRRSLYLPIVRNNIYDLFQLLDAPDGAVTSGDRATTTVAPQALLMLNSELVMQAASGLAERLLESSGTDDGRLQRLYSLAYGREVLAEERTAGLAYLAAAERLLTATEPEFGKRRREAWTSLCHTIVAANEFIYLQ